MRLAAAKWIAVLALVTLTAGFGSCNGGRGNPPQYVLQGSVSGLLPGQSVVLQNLGSDTTKVSTNGGFEFSTLLHGGAPFSVTVLTQPTGENCTTVNGSGAGTIGPGDQVIVACTTTYTVSGTVTGSPWGGTAVLQLNGGDDLTVSLPTVNGVSVPFRFSQAIPIGTRYTVTILHTPIYASCVLELNGQFNNGGQSSVSGIGTADVTDIDLQCTGVLFSVGPTVSGLLPDQSVTLKTSAGQPPGVYGYPSTVTSIATTNGYCNQCQADGAASFGYTVAIMSQPAGETCTGAQQGTIGEQNITVAIVCAASYTVSGSVSGSPWGGTAVLQLNGGDDLTVSLPTVNGVSVPFRFSETLPIETPYTVTILHAPIYSSCGFELNGQLNNGGQSSVSGVGTADVTNIDLQCTGVLFNVGPTVSGLLPNHSVTLKTSAGQPPGVYGYPSTVTGIATTNGYCNQCQADGAASFAYTVAIVSQPAGETCTGAQQGTIGEQNITVAIVCAASGYTIGGVVSGLLGGKTVVLQDNGGNVTPVSANGPFTFSTALANQAPYAVTIVTRPAGQTCSVTNGTGLVPGANVTNVAIVCTAVSYTIGGTVSGLSAGESVVLEDNGGNATTVSANGPFNFSTPIAFQAPYAVTVATQPAGESCAVIQGSGTTPAANVTTVIVTCAVLNEWTWESGSNVAWAAGMYGTLGKAAPGNVPGARFALASWVDTANNLWLFGGAYANTSGDVGELNDLWEYHEMTGLWTWQGGSSTLNSSGSYGTQGAAALTNVPGARAGAASWTDSAGNFWLFGGSSGAGVFNDLWRYEPNTGFWTWMSGSNSQNAVGVFGTQGTAAAGNVPGARQGSVSWVDKAGNLWLLGGYGLGAANSYLNDLWVYSKSTGLWTWMGGSDVSGAIGVYGTRGVAALGNAPGARTGAASWTDSSGNFWLFGGTDANGAFNDLWRYSPTTGQWAWMSGSTVTGAGGVYGTQGTRAAGNTPCARFSPMSWADAAGNLWLFGGTVYGGSFLNDLWEYTPSTGLWTWISGSNQQRQVGVYGTLGVAVPANIAGARTGSATWVDRAGNFWLFGGDAFVSADPSYPGLINDLWRYVPPVP